MYVQLQICNSSPESQKVISIKFFRSTDAHRRVLEHFGLKNQLLAAADFMPAIFAFFK
jgi:hypothetical protein